MCLAEILRKIVLATLCVVLLCVVGQTAAKNQEAIEPRANQPPAPPAVTKFAKRYLRSIQYTNPLRLPSGKWPGFHPPRRFTITWRWVESYRCPLERFKTAIGLGLTLLVARRLFLGEWTW